LPPAIRTFGGYQVANVVSSMRPELHYPSDRANAGS
jgi:hypothetical protein